MKSKLWLFNFFGVICKSNRRVRQGHVSNVIYLGPYVILVILNFVL